MPGDPPAGDVTGTRSPTDLDPADWVEVRGRFNTDPVYRRALLAAYRGEWALTDLLRWQIDPAARATDGATSPYIRFDQLRHSLYRAQAPRSELERAMRLQERIAEHEGLLDDAERSLRRADIAPVPPTRLPALQRRRLNRFALIPAASILLLLLVWLVPAPPHAPKPAPTRMNPARSLQLASSTADLLSSPEEDASSAVRAALSRAGRAVIPAMANPSRSAQKFWLATSSTVFDVNGLDNFGEMTAITVLLTCKQEVDVGWQLTGTEPVSPTENREVLIDQRTIGCGPNGAAVTVGLVYHENPTKLALRLATRTRFAVLVQTTG